MMIEFLLAIISTIMSGFAIIVMKYSLDTNDYPKVSKWPYKIAKNTISLLKNPKYILGGVLLVFSWALRLLSTIIADLSYIRTIFVSHLAIVIIGSILLFKEKIEKSLLISISFMIIGLIATSLSQPLTRKTDGNWSIFIILSFILFPFGIIFLILAIKDRRYRNISAAISSAFFYGTGILAQGLFAAYYLSEMRFLEISWYLELLSTPFIYFMVFCTALGFILSNLMAYKINLSVVYPISYPLSELITVIGSIMIFQEDISIQGNPLRLIGMIFLFVGLFFIIFTQRNHLARFKEKEAQIET